jgi:hypothetical protein
LLLFAIKPSIMTSRGKLIFVSHNQKIFLLSAVLD